MIGVIPAIQRIVAVTSFPAKTPVFVIAPQEYFFRMTMPSFRARRSDKSRRHCERSEAISLGYATVLGDCRVAALLAKTGGLVALGDCRATSWLAKTE